MPQAHAQQAGVGEYRGVLSDGGEQAGEEAAAGAGVHGGEVGDQVQGEYSLSQGGSVGLGLDLVVVGERDLVAIGVSLANVSCFVEGV